MRRQLTNYQKDEHLEYCRQQQQQEQQQSQRYYYNQQQQQHYQQQSQQHQQQQSQQQRQQQHPYYQQQQQQQINKASPQSTLQQLKTIYHNVLQRQRQHLNQLLNLQKLLNYIHSTTPITKNQISRQQQKINKNTKQQQKKQFNLERIGEKIQKIIDQTDEVVVVVEEEQQKQQEQDGKVNQHNSQVRSIDQQKRQQVRSNNKNDSISNKTTTSNKKITILPTNKLNINKKQSTTKPLNYKLQPMPVQKKKPPLPSVNIATNRVFNQTKYIPPRNKNEVTGKVTQTKIMTQQKVFKPQINQNKPNYITSSSTTKISSSVQKRQSNTNTQQSSITNKTSTIKQQTNNQTATNTSSQNMLQSSSPTVQDINSISEYKNLRMANNKSIKLKQFNKPIKQLYQQSIKKKQSSSLSSRKKHNFKQLIQKYQQQQMGHRNLQQKRRLQYIRKLNNFSLSINQSNCNQITNSIKKRSWKGYLPIFQFNQILQKLQSDIQNIEQQYRQDLRSDPKQVYKLQCMLKYVQRQVGKIMASTEIQVPQKLQLTFTPIMANKKQQQLLNKTKQNNIISEQQQQQQTPSLQPFYRQLLSLLEQTKQNQSLSTKDLSLLRVIAEVILYDGRKAPMIVKNNQFQQWKQSYQQVDHNQHLKDNQLLKYQ